MVEEEKGEERESSLLLRVAVVEVVGVSRHKIYKPMLFGNKRKPAPSKRTTLISVEREEEERKKREREEEERRLRCCRESSLLFRLRKANGTSGGPRPRYKVQNQSRKYFSE